MKFCCEVQTFALYSVYDRLCGTFTWGPQQEQALDPRLEVRVPTAKRRRSHVGRQQLRRRRRCCCTTRCSNTSSPSSSPWSLSTPSQARQPCIAASGELFAATGTNDDTRRALPRWAALQGALLFHAPKVLKGEIKFDVTATIFVVVPWKFNMSAHKPA